MATVTKWGKSQTRRNITRGINFYTTASHGGYVLSAGMNKRIPEQFRSEDRSYEEDCDWAIVVTFLPENIGETVRDQAAKTLRDWNPDAYEFKYGVELKPGQSYIKDRKRLEEENASKYVTVAAWGDWHDQVPAGMVGIKAHMKSEGIDGWFLVPTVEYQARDMSTGIGFVIDTARHRAWFGSGTEIVA